MGWVIRCSDDQAMSDAHIAWAKSRARVLGIDEDDPQVDGLGVAVWKPAFFAGVKYGRLSSGANVLGELSDSEKVMSDFIGLCEESFTPELWDSLARTCELLSGVRGGTMSFLKCLQHRGHTTP